MKITREYVRNRHSRYYILRWILSPSTYHTNWSSRQLLREYYAGTRHDLSCLQLWPTIWTVRGQFLALLASFTRMCYFTIQYFSSIIRTFDWFRKLGDDETGRIKDELIKTWWIRREAERNSLLWKEGNWNSWPRFLLKEKKKKTSLSYYNSHCDNWPNINSLQISLTR